MLAQMTPIWRWLLALGAIALGTLLLLPYFRPTATAGPGTLVGESLPQLPLLALDGKPFALRRTLGHVVVVNLWASWCPPCRAEMPDLERISRDDAARGVRVIGIDEGESPAVAGAFARSLGIDYRVVADPRQRYGRAFGAFGLPTTAIVNSRGRIVRAFDGPLTYVQVARALAAVH
ncbi:MAG TPA: TlpA disulfide reductase family protein [Candidatus Dormibacteraeota bacterium]|nr:TlpA disulfide reductase family protein [Candidatus Dormibacteraeota bacterium]